MLYTTKSDGSRGDPYVTSPIQSNISKGQLKHTLISSLYSINSRMADHISYQS